MPKINDKLSMVNGELGNDSTNNLQLTTYNSNIPWLGDIPQGWEVRRLKTIAKIETGWTPPKAEPANYSDDGIPWIKPDNLDGLNYLTNSQEKISDKGLATGCPVVSKDDILVCCIGTVGKIGIAGCELTFNQQINSVTFNPSIINKEYGKYLILSSQEEHFRNSQIVVVGILNKTKQGNIYFCIPPLQTQSAIVKFLDEKTTKISEFIKNKKELIELLKEQKKSLIYSSVTKGIDKNVKLKSSGVPWLGDIPQEWEVRRLKQLGKIVNGSTPSSDKKEFWEGDIDWVTPTDLGKVDDPNIYESQRKITQKGLDSCGTSLVPKNSIIMSCRAPIGSLGIATKEMCTNQGCKSFTPYDFMNFKFSYYYFVGFNDYYQNLGKGTTFQELSTSDFNDSIFLLPPAPIQTAVVEFLDEKTAKIDETIATIQQEIELVEEYKKSLIYQVVTGKITV